MEKVKYIEDKSTGIELVKIEKSNIAYPPHTHIGHYVFGIVTEGVISIKIGDSSIECERGECYSIFPDVRHSVKPISATYSMVTTCIPVGSDFSRELDFLHSDGIPQNLNTAWREGIRRNFDEARRKVKLYELDELRKEIINTPETDITIAEMSEKVNISPYHLIRKFTAENGLTPHKFQTQCRVRKAKELLREGYRVAEVAYMAGFFDQSHLDRVFKKQVGLTPEQFSNSAILSNAV